MEWARYTLREVAPAIPNRNSPDSGDAVWHLGLDQIESHTGIVLSKYRAPVSAAGNSTLYFDQSHVLYSKLRPYLNKVVIPDEPGIATTELIPLKPRPNLVCREFLAYYLRSPVFLAYASQYVTGAKMPRVILDRFWAHEVLLPPLSEQRRIVEILDQADRLRRLRTEADAKAGRILPALFIKMFGDPATNPMGWPVRPLGDAIVETQYGTSKRANTDGQGVPVLRMNNISSAGEIDLSDVKFVDLDPTELERQLLQLGDILFNRTNSIELVGKTGLWEKSGLQAVAASYLIRVRVNRDKLVPSYVWALMQSAHMKSVLAARARRAVGMANINATELRRLPAMFPPLQLQKDFVARSASIRQTNEHRCRSLNSTEQLFRNLLSRAFSGTLTASGREAHTSKFATMPAKQTHSCEG